MTQAHRKSEGLSIQRVKQMQFFFQLEQGQKEGHLDTLEEREWVQVLG